MATLFNTRIADTYQGLLKTIDNGILGAGFTEISDGSGNGTSVFLNTSGDIQATGIISFGSLKDIGENITITKFVDAADGLINNDNDTTIPTSAAIIDYVATQITLEDLDFTGDGATSGSVDLDSQTFNIIGTANEITTSAINQTLTIGLPSSITISGILTATTLLGDLNGTINTATTAVTQPLGDNSTKVATTAFVDRVITAQDLDFQGTTGSGSVDLDSQTLTIQGTTNEITTVASGQTLTVGLPSSITTDLVGNVTGNVTGNLTGDVTGNLTGNTNGIHTGNVIGNVTGDVTGALTGNVTGNVVGDLTGNTTGLHTGNVVGNVTGDLSGDVTGNVTGNVVGDLTGNVTGNVVGNVTGDLTGNADTATAWANGRTITLTGEATGVTPSIDGTTNVSAALTLTNSAVIDKVLTGLQSPAGATILATDSMLIAFGKLQSQINGIAEGLQYQGSWNASTNTPTLTSSVGTQGFYYIVNVAGSTNLNGITDWEVGDWAIFSTTGVWQRLDQTGVQGTGTTGTLTKWATGSTISDSIVSESGTALTVTGSLDTTLGSNIAGEFSVNTNKFTVGSATGNVVASGQLQGNDLDIVTTSVLSGNVTMSADASVGGTLTTASPVINTGISGSAVLDDDTFATANSTTVATSESIKAYVDAQDQGSGTVGTIAKFATSTTFNNSVITQGGSGGTELFLGGETYIPSNELIVGANNQNAATERIELDGSGNHIGGGNVIISHNRNLDIGTNDANSFGIWTTNQQRFNMSSGGTATFFGNLIGTSATFSGSVDIYKTTDSQLQIKSENEDATLIINSGADGVGGANREEGFIKFYQDNADFFTLGKRNNGQFVLTDHTASQDVITFQDGGGILIQPANNLTTFSGTTSANVVISRDNMFVGLGQLYIGAENSNTDDTYRQSVGSGIFKIQSRESGTWTDRLTISSVGAATFSGNVTSGGTLTVNGTGNSAFAGQVFINGLSNYTGLTLTGSGGARPAINFNNVNNGVLGSIFGTEGNELIISANGISALTISSGGDVTMSKPEGWRFISSGLNQTYISNQSAWNAGNYNSLVFSGRYRSSANDATALGEVRVVKEQTTNDGFYGGEMSFWTRVNGGSMTKRLTIESNGKIRNASPPSGDWAMMIEGSAVGGNSYGLKLNAGTNASDRGLTVSNYYNAEQMYVKGTGGGYLNATAWTYNSDLRLKENISDVQNGIDTVLKMKPKHFDYIDGNKNNLGFIAQEIQEIIPQAVSVVNEDTGYLGLQTDFLVPYLTKAIQEQQTIIDTLTARLDVLEKKA